MYSVRNVRKRPKDARVCWLFNIHLRVALEILHSTFSSFVFVCLETQTWTRLNLVPFRAHCRSSTLSESALCCYIIKSSHILQLSRVLQCNSLCLYILCGGLKWRSRQAVSRRWLQSQANICSLIIRTFGCPPALTQTPALTYVHIYYYHWVTDKLLIWQNDKIIVVS